ncbi:diacylglycerol kinase family protein [Patescibacteria group bacterium]|nr:diacylglycerol kinase family protein [Patescibacteria group bacterium]MBU4511834.1 diacylglycerol kinase family protein [Patescibacteria group bacterium]MCG2693435.1 diacylglycerol kinase family protein [Candidatus Parcubacteria bacterium]
MFHLKNLYKSFKHAFLGLFQVLREEQSFRIQISLAIVVIILAFYFRITAWEKIALLMVIVGVLVLELVNTIFERLSDVFKPRIHDYIKQVKDIMAAAVLIASGGALVVGVLIFWKYIF